MQYTTNYSLRKPQLGEPAKVEDINYNSDSVDNLVYQNRRMVKEYEYDSTKQYHAGDTEIHEGVYYKCLDDTTGVWDPTKWEQTDLTAEIDYAKQHDIEIINLEVRSDNMSAIHLYEKYGYKKTGTIPAFFKINKEYVDFDIMSLDLR